MLEGRKMGARAQHLCLLIETETLRNEGEFARESGRTIEFVMLVVALGGVAGCERFK